MRQGIKFSLAALALALFCGAKVGHADTISVHDISQDTVNGIFTYSINLDAAADVHSGDGFVIYDFAGLTSFTLTGLNNNNFTLTQMLTSNNLTDSSTVDSAGFVAALSNSIPFDSSTLENLSFAYTGATPLTGSQIGTLTLHTDILGGTTTGVYAAIDHSGISIENPFGIAEGPILVPIAGVLPPPSTGVPEISVGGLASLAVVMIGALALLEGSKSKTRVA
jgi:hypothetical protein